MVVLGWIFGKLIGCVEKMGNCVGYWGGFFESFIGKGDRL